MNKLKSRFSWLFGLAIARLKKHSAITRMVNHIRNTYPGTWKTIANKLRPFYWTYQARVLEESEEAFFKDTSAFNEQDWKNKRLRNRARHPESICDGVTNNRPVVDPAVLLEKINSIAAMNRH